MFPLFRLGCDRLWTYPISVSSKIKTLALKQASGESFFFFNRSLLEEVGDWNGVGEDSVDSEIGLGDADGVDFDDDGVGVVEEVGAAAGVVDLDFVDVAVDFRGVRVDFDVVGLDFGDVGFNIITG